MTYCLGFQSEGNQSYHLAVAYIARIFHILCNNGCGAREVSNHRILKYVLDMARPQKFQNSRAYKYRRSVLEDNEGRNTLIHQICFSASCQWMPKIYTVLLDELPRNLVSVQTLPMISRYIRRECGSTLWIPHAIAELIALFF